MLHKRQNTLRKAYALFVLVAAHLGQIAKTRQKLHSKNSWNWVVILVSATIWQVLNVKCIKTGNGNDVNQLKTALKMSWNQIKWTSFWHILPIWNQSVPSPAHLPRFLTFSPLFSILMIALMPVWLGGWVPSPGGGAARGMISLTFKGPL